MTAPLYRSAACAVAHGFLARPEQQRCLLAAALASVQAAFGAIGLNSVALCSDANTMTGPLR